MKYRLLATDYDGTLADDGSVDELTLRALGRLKETGRSLVLITGREVPELLEAFPQVGIFDKVVAENGAVLFQPESGDCTPLANAPSEDFIRLLKQRGIDPLSVGRVIVATRQPLETIVLQTIRDLGLELQVIFNKGAVMVLPTGVNKGTGLNAAIQELVVTADQVVAMGDGENDHSLLEAAGMGIAVSNAVPFLKSHAKLVTQNPASRGVIEIIDRLIANDLQDLNEPKPT